MKTVPLLVRFFFLALLTSCGYHLGHTGALCQYSSLSVPYVQGDPDGDLTMAIVEEVVRSGCFEYRAEGGNLQLLAKIIDIDEENIGFRYDRHKRGRLSHSIIPSEARLTLLVEMSVLDACSNRAVINPIRLTASVEVDHEYNSSRHRINVFSLGQLSDADAAFETAQRPLNRLMAKKIIDYVTESW